MATTSKTAPRNTPVTHFFREGKMIGCVRGDVRDRNHSPVGFGKTRRDAEADLDKKERFAAAANRSRMTGFEYNKTQEARAQHR